MNFSVQQHRGYFYVAISGGLYRDFDGFEYEYSGGHFHDFENEEDAQAFLEKVEAAGLPLDHFMESPHWRGGSRMTYESYCKGFAAGILHEDGHVMGNRRSQHMP